MGILLRLLWYGLALFAGSYIVFSGVLGANIYFATLWSFLAVAIVGWLFVYIVTPNTLAIPVLFGDRLDDVLREGIQLYYPFCALIEHSLAPRERVPFDISVNVQDDQVECKGYLGFQLLRPERMAAKLSERGVAHISGEKNYLILYDRRQTQIETDAIARVKEMLDEMLAKVPAECALSKEINDAVQVAIVKGLKHRQIPGGRQPPPEQQAVLRIKTAEQSIIELIKTFKQNYTEKMKKRGVAPTDLPDIPVPEERDLPDNDPNMRGLERIFLEDYGVELMVYTLAIEPSQRTIEARSKQRQREIEREIERLDTELVMAMKNKVKADNPGMSDEEAFKNVMIIQEYYAQPNVTEFDLRIKGLEGISPETAAAVAEVARKWSAEKDKGGSGKGKAKRKHRNKDAKEKGGQA